MRNLFKVNDKDTSTRFDFEVANGGWAGSPFHANAPLYSKVHQSSAENIEKLRSKWVMLVQNGLMNIFLKWIPSKSTRGLFFDAASGGYCTRYH